MSVSLALYTMVYHWYHWYESWYTLVATTWRISLNTISEEAHGMTAIYNNFCDIELTLHNLSRLMSCMHGYAGHFDFGSTNIVSCKN